MNFPEFKFSGFDSPPRSPTVSESGKPKQKKKTEKNPRFPASDSPIPRHPVRASVYCVRLVNSVDVAHARDVFRAKRPLTSLSSAAGIFPVLFGARRGHSPRRSAAYATRQYFAESGTTGVGNHITTHRNRPITMVSAGTGRAAPGKGKTRFSRKNRKKMSKRH